MMQDRKEAHPDTAMSERAKEPGHASRRGHASMSQSTTAPPRPQVVHIADLLPHGAENGVPLRLLENLTGWDGRTIRRQIERERRAGALIISDNQHGYFLTDDPAEAQRFARSMQHRAREILRTARAIEGAVVVGE